MSRQERVAVGPTTDTFAIDADNAVLIRRALALLLTRLVITTTFGMWA